MLTLLNRSLFSHSEPDGPSIHEVPFKSSKSKPRSLVTMVILLQIPVLVHHLSSFACELALEPEAPRG